MADSIECIKNKQGELVILHQECNTAQICTHVGQMTNEVSRNLPDPTENIDTVGYRSRNSDFMFVEFMRAIEEAFSTHISMMALGRSGVRARDEERVSGVGSLAVHILNVYNRPP